MNKVLKSVSLSHPEGHTLTFPPGGNHFTLNGSWRNMFVGLNLRPLHCEVAALTTEQSGHTLLIQYKERYNQHCSWLRENLSGPQTLKSELLPLQIPSCKKK